ncbi:MAG: RHS repeat-associated protein [Arenicella sp.]|jgi:RHS repeat-associated protein
MEKIKTSMQKLKNSINNMPEQNQLSSANMNAKPNTKLSTGKTLAAIIFSVCLCLIVPSINSAQASTTVSERVDFSRAMPEENVEDMSVKVLGGSISVNRFYRVMKRNPDEAGYPGVSGDLQGYNGNTLQSEAFLFEAGKAKRNDFAVWQFHRRWHDLLFVETRVGYATTSGGSPSDGSTTGSGPSSGDSSLLDAPKPRLIDRNDYLYELKDGEDYYVYEHNGNDLRITITDTGFRWSNRQGDWIDYDEAGLAIRSGNKNGVSINLVRENGFITHYKDHFGNTVVTWEYLNGKPVKATDYDGRVVEYKWQGHDLVEVTTTRGHKWKYGYSQIGLNRVMTSKTDPENQTFLYEFQQTEGGFQYSTPSSGGPDVTLIGDDTPVAISSGGSSGGSSNQASFSVPVEPTLMHTAMIYPDGKRVRYQYRYDPQSESYMILEVNSDGVERERWFDLDGQVRYHLVGGRVAGVRVRNSQTAVSRDAYGNRTTKKYTRFEAIESITYADGGTVKYEYLPNYNLPTLVTDQLGFKTKHEYDAKGNRIKTIEGLGADDVRVVEFVYDQYGQLATTRYVGRTNKDGSVSPTIETVTMYDSYGNITRVIDGNGNATQYQDYTSFGRPKTRVDGRGHTSVYRYDAQGNLTLSASSLGFETHIEYDALHRVTRHRDAELRATSYQYDSRNNAEKVIDNLGGERKTTYRMDGQILNSTDPSGQTMVYKYDRSGRPTEMIDGVGNTTLTRYVKQAEIFGRLVESIETPNAKTSFTYDSRNRQINLRNVSIKSDDLVSVSTTNYTLRGNAKNQTDPNGNVTQLSYNPHGEIAQQTNAAGDVVFSNYDNRGNLIRVIDGLGNKTHYEYDGVNNKKSETRPFGGEGANTQKQYYYFDEVNNLVGKTDYKGNVTLFVFDEDNRLKGSSNTPASEPIKDGSKADRVISYAYDKSNLLKNYDDDRLSIEYQYDGLARLVKQISSFTGFPGQGTSNGFSKELSTSYYPNGQIKTKTDPEGNVSNFHYDAAGRLQKMAIQNAGSIVFNSYEGNLLTKMSYPGGVTRELEYDGLARLNRILVTNNAQNPIMDFRYDFDAKGNIVQRDTALNANSAAEGYRYVYDGIDRLISATQPNTFGDQAYKYDENSNRTQLTQTIDDETVEQNFAYSERQEFLGLQGEGVSPVSNTYDENGALQADDLVNKTLRYNSFGRVEQLISTQNAVSISSNYLYDGMERRVAKIVNDQATIFLYDDLGVGLSAEYDGNGNLIRSYGYFPTSSFTTDPVYMKVRQSNLDEFAFYQNDHLGTPQQLIKDNGEIVWQAIYDAFGKAEQVVSTFKQPIRFPGQYYDEESYFHYNWNRYYDPEIGRYVTSDPIGLGGGLNSYGYVVGNPLRYSDPEGLAHRSGRWKNCGGGCRIRIDYDHVGEGRHLHWECPGKSGAMGEHGRPSHGATGQSAPNRIKQCAADNGFEIDPLPLPDDSNEFVLCTNIEECDSWVQIGLLGIGLTCALILGPFGEALR